MQVTHIEKDNKNKDKPIVAAINTSYKITVFRKLFNKPDKLLELYNALNNRCYTDTEELEINTLDNSLQKYNLCLRKEFYD